MATRGKPTVAPVRTQTVAPLGRPPATPLVGNAPLGPANTGPPVFVDAPPPTIDAKQPRQTNTVPPKAATPGRIGPVTLKAGGNALALPTGARGNAVALPTRTAVKPANTGPPAPLGAPYVAPLPVIVPKATPMPATQASPLPDQELQPRVFTLADAVITSTSPERIYYRRTDDEKMSIHYGQLKLLMSEIQFLTRYWDPVTVPNPIVVYAGAAPGHHIPFLSQLFPAVKFHLYDPRPFRIANSETITTYQQYFTDADAAKWANRNDVFLISDIRTAQPYKISATGVQERVMSEVEVEERVEADNRMQESWYKIMKPVKAHLKFRLAYPHVPSVKKQFSYLDGTIFLQAWAPQTSTETRLVPFGFQEKVYDIVKYERQLFYVNTVLRERVSYYNPFDPPGTQVLRPIDPPDLTNDFDSSLHTLILIEYLTKMLGREQANEENVIGLAHVLMEKLTEHQSRQKITPGLLRAGEKSIRRLVTKNKAERVKTPTTGGRIKRQDIAPVAKVEDLTNQGLDELDDELDDEE